MPSRVKLNPALGPCLIQEYYFHGNFISSFRCIVVSTLNEAELYANNGFDDILYGYPLLDQHMSRNFELTRNLDQYHVMINSLKSLETLLKYEPPKGTVNQVPT